MSWRTMRRARRAVPWAGAVLLFATFCSDAGAGGSSTPAITSIDASPRVIPAAGGRVVVNAGVADSSTCTFSGNGIDELREPCTDGDAGEAISFGVNSAPAPRLWRIALVSAANGLRSNLREVTVLQQGAPVPAALAAALDRCAPGPGCDYGPIEARYPTYGNVAPANVGDCAFAAAADWEEIVLGDSPTPAAVIAAFEAAGGRAHGGLSLAALWSYWQQDGIAGVRMLDHIAFSTSPGGVEAAVREYAALLVEFRFSAHDELAQYAMSAGYHLAVVDGFTPRGPLVVSWGRTLQMSWSQWRAEAVAAWGVAAR